MTISELWQEHGGLPMPGDAERTWTSIQHSEAHHSTALEGNTLVMREVEVLLSQGRAIGNKELKEYLEVQGYATAARWVYEQARSPGAWRGELMTLRDVRQAHTLAMTLVWEVAPHPEGTDEEGPANYRRHNLQAFGDGIRPPDFTDLPSFMTDWVTAVNRIAQDRRPIGVAVAHLHGAFERIHPFLDGNGRTGRLLMNLTLVRLGYPPAIIMRRDRNRYLGGLGRSDRGDPELLGELVARAVLDNVMRFVVPRLDGLAPLKALVTSGFSLVALRAAAERGRLRAVRGVDGGWRSRREWVEEYGKGRYTRDGQYTEPLSQARI